MIIFCCMMWLLCRFLVVTALAEEPAFRGWVARRAKRIYQINEDFETL